jgi:sortase B
MTKRDKHVEKKIKKKTKIVRIVLFIIFLIIFVFSLVNLIRWTVYNSRSKKDIENIQEAVIVNDFNIEDSTKEKNPVDFNALKEINEDAVAWIRIDGTNINYPILQTTDNDYYLHLDIYKKYSTCGWIFMDWQNSDNFIDKNTVIYGHNIKSGVMFADLLNIYRGQLGKDVTIEIYTPEKVLKYKVFSSYLTEPEDYAIKSNIVTEESMDAYVKTMVSRSTINYNIVPTKVDKVLTLSTCDNSGQNRVLVHGILMSEESY